MLGACVASAATLLLGWLLRQLCWAFTDAVVWLGAAAGAVWGARWFARSMTFAGYASFVSRGIERECAAYVQRRVRAAVRSIDELVGSLSSPTSVVAFHRARWVGGAAGAAWARGQRRSLPPLPLLQRCCAERARRCFAAVPASDDEAARRGSVRCDRSGHPRCHAPAPRGGPALCPAQAIATAGQLRRRRLRSRGRDVVHGPANAFGRRDRRGGRCPG